MRWPLVLLPTFFGCDNSCEQVAVYVDADRDGFGDVDRVGYGCEDRITEVDPGFSFVAGDCDDRDPAIHPGADEICDDIDNDCDGSVDVEPLDPKILYADADGDGFGDPSTRTESSCGLRAGYVSNADDCDDRADLIYPGAAEHCDGVDNDCDLALTPCESWIVEGIRIDGVAEGDYLGNAIASGDVDGDGRADLLLGGELSGAAYLLYGPISVGGVVDGISDEVAIFREVMADDMAGASVALGDLDGDDVDDVVVGLPWYDTNEGGDRKLGAVAIVRGGRRLTSASLADADQFIRGTQWRGRVGWTVSVIDDVTGDGKPEVAAGAQRYRPPWKNEERGGVILLSGGGATDGMSAISGLQMVGEGLGGLGERDAVSADVNGDGMNDLLATAYLASIEGADGGRSGRVYLVAGPITADQDFVEDRPPNLVGSHPEARLGYGSVAADVDKDGYADVFIGAHSQNTPSTAAGAVWLIPGAMTLDAWDGGAVDAAASAEIQSAEANAGFGSALDLNDVDGDAQLDLAVGAMYLGTEEGGGAFFFYGPVEGNLDAEDADLILTRDGPDGYVDRAHMGKLIEIGGDLLGSGNTTLMISSPYDPIVPNESGAVYLQELIR
ncbi:MAG: putative metal-binding motif-containing protein [Myxococcota bacterium]